MAGATTTVTAEFLGTENVARQMNVLGRAGAQFSSDLTSKLGKMFGAVAIGTMAFSKMEQAISKNMATAKQVSSLAVKFNVDPSQVHSMKIAADDAGVSIRSLMMASKQFGKVAGEALSNKSAAENMKQLGISAEKLADMQSKPMKYLPEAAVALAQIADENERAAAGAFLFGRQYQQISPLLEKLGSDEQARGEFLSNNNAMTNEQIKLNKEAARIQSQMSDGWDKFMASAAKPLNWAMQFVSYLSSALEVQAAMIANHEKMKAGEAKEEAGNVVGRVQAYAEGVAARTKATSDKIPIAASFGQTDEEAGITKEARAEYDAVYAAGGVEKYVELQLKKADVLGNKGRKTQESFERQAQFGGPAGAIPINTHKETKEEKDAKATIDPKLLQVVGGESRLMDLDSDTNKRARRALRVAGATSRVGHGLISTASYKPGADGEYQFKAGLNELASGLINEGQAEQREAEVAKEKAQINAMRAAARLVGDEYDAVSGRTMSRDDYDELMRKRAASVSGNPLEFTEAKAADAAKKKKKSQTRAFEKSERHLREGGMSPLEKAEAAVKEVGEDMIPINEDLIEKADEITKSKERTAAAEAKLIALNEKKANGERLAQEFIDKANAALAEDGDKLDEKDIAKIKAKFSLTKDETEKIQQLNGAIRGEAKALAGLEGEMLDLKTKLNGELAKQTAAEDALRKAKEAAWAKEKAAAKDIHDDEKAYEREMQELKYKDMKNAGKTQLDILKEKYNYELQQYTEASEEKDALEAEISAKQAARVEEAFQRGEEDAYKFGEATDEEKAAIKAAREKKDKGRQGLEKAVYDFDQFKPHAVVSELGKMGGGAAVQFGNNPIDEIRKSNSFLKAIEKNTSTANIKAVQTFVTPSNAPHPDEGLFGEDVPM